eukprot:12043608-Alexandrium_andersonii.AAC.1
MGAVGGTLRTTRVVCRVPRARHREHWCQTELRADGVAHRCPRVYASREECRASRTPPSHRTPWMRVLTASEREPTQTG